MKSDVWSEDRNGVYVGDSDELDDEISRQFGKPHFNVQFSNSTHLPMLFIYLLINRQSHAQAAVGTRCRL